MKQPAVRYILSLAALIWFAAPAAATVYTPVDFREMATGATYILHGRIVDVRAEPTVDHRSIVTYVTLDVVDRLKGNPGESVVFRVPGGQVGRYRRIVVGAPQFTRGDEVILFLSTRGPSIPYLFGLSQGVFRVSRSSGSAMVMPPVIMAGGAGAERVVRGDPARRPLAVDEFAREVRAVLGAGRGQ